jgi:hypothetical protein
VANTLMITASGDRDFIDWLDPLASIQLSWMSPACAETMQAENTEARYDEHETSDAKP